MGRRVAGCRPALGEPALRPAAITSGREIGGPGRDTTARSARSRRCHATGILVGKLQAVPFPDVGFAVGEELNPDPGGPQAVGPDDCAAEIGAVHA